MLRCRGPSPWSRLLFQWCSVQHLSHQRPGPLTVGDAAEDSTARGPTLTHRVLNKTKELRDKVLAWEWGSSPKGFLDSFTTWLDTDSQTSYANSPEGRPVFHCCPHSRDKDRLMLREEPWAQTQIRGPCKRGWRGCAAPSHEDNTAP